VEKKKKERRKGNLPVADVEGGKGENEWRWNRAAVSSTHTYTHRSRAPAPLEKSCKFSLFSCQMMLHRRVKMANEAY